MASANIEKVVFDTVETIVSEKLQETIRQIKEQAWNEGHEAGTNDESKLNNPYLKEY